MEEGPDSPSSQAELGTQLARLHAIEQPYFGWSRDNCIGATPQPNPRSDDWVSFYADHRLAHQFDLARNKGQSFAGSPGFWKTFPPSSPITPPRPALLHGDLWGGNASCDKQGTPFVYDPASYYGDRETDIAFTHMFGGFSQAFHEAYEAVYPLDPGFKIRKILYNLYHELNHFNLFGGLCLIRSIQRPSTSGSSFLKNDIKQILLSEEDIRKRIAELGLEIDRHYEGKEILIVTLLDGAIVFTADLIRNLSIPLRLDCMRVSSYGDSTDPKPLPGFLVPSNPAFRTGTSCWSTIFWTRATQ